MTNKLYTPKEPVLLSAKDSTDGCFLL